MATKEKTHVLLVEGFADRDFFEQICKHLPINPVVQVATSKDFQNSLNTKEDVFKLLPNLLKRIQANELERLAVVVDADKSEHGSGYIKTLKRIKEIVADYGFLLTENQTEGLIFKHEAGLADFGAWITPNNQDDGILEDFIKSCVAKEEQPLFNHALDIVKNLPEPKKFAAHHFSKAEVATWLAWQKPPGHGFYYAVSDKLLDESHALFKELQNWLKTVFPNQESIS